MCHIWSAGYLFEYRVWEGLVWCRIAGISDLLLKLNNNLHQGEELLGRCLIDFEEAIEETFNDFLEYLD